MHLQSLELFGFKSFVDKTVFNFHEGVTAIVGPNGCGKSNVLDAVRWVLGEQSAKALRGGEMADVIFNGTDTRKPVGYAEVSLTFSDCASELGVDWHDVRVSRRVYRDGLSEYLLNKTVVRLKDVQALFADTGVGRSAYSIMEQGRIDQILSSRPEDRRAVFEEAAGITKYKTQKREALRKLEATEANLLRLGDIIKEVKRQIGSLQRQAGKARRYQALLADLQVLDTHHSRDQLDSLGTELEISRATTARLDEQQHTTEGAIEEQENAVATERRGLDEIDAQINDARAEVQRLENQIAAHRSRIEFNRERAQELATLIERYESDVAAAESKLAQQETEIHDTDALLGETERLLASKKEELTTAADRAAAVRREREEQDQALQTLELAISKTEHRLEDLAQEIVGTQERHGATRPRVAELEASLGNAGAERDQIASRLEALRATAHEQAESMQSAAVKIPAAEEELNRLNASVRETESALLTGERALTERQSRLEVLQQLNREGEGLAEGSQALLKGLDDPDRLLPALVGALASLIEVEEKFIPAVEAALGRNLHAIVLRDDAVAVEIITKLSDKKLGQTALIAPELLREGATEKENALPAGTLGWASEKVQAPPDLEAVVRQLLGGVALVSDLAQARTLKAQNPSLAFATFNGEFVSRRGIIYGGRVDAESSSLFARKAQIASLGAEHRELLAARETLQNQRTKAERAVKRAAEKLDEIRETHQTARGAHSATSVEINALERELHEANRKADALAWEKTTLDQQLVVATERVAALESETIDLQNALDSKHAERTNRRSAAEAARLRDAELAEQLSELRLAVATERQRHEGLRSQRQPMTARQAELAELIATRRADIAAYQSRREQQAIESSAAEEAIESIGEALAQAVANVREIAATRSSRLTRVTAFEAELRTARKALSDLHEARGKEEVRQTQLQIKIENLTEHVMRRYQIDLREFAPDRYAFTKTLRAQIKRNAKEDEPNEPDAAELFQIIAELTRQLDAMGPVNLDAVQEYDELEERHTFLETQNTDLTNSRRELLDVIARINQTTEKLFAETFAQVKINFREMFAELFGGGRADLALLDEKDALNCGIDIIAKPPGKQLQSISLLSGGERTMTAVALLFAIYMVRPSPFCILDEMDAPLDESNINRFIKMLDRFVSQSQFIIITHNKRTIAKADILYGVTMEERGVSKLVGIRLSAAQPEAQQPIKLEQPKQRPLELEEAGPENLALTR
ncbi:MAG: chromosome segregation protein SMC [Chthoniobacterales bacterium]|nr:chromosome segregation protein SMC [Chthoniobacterales bacterium]